MESHDEQCKWTVGDDHDGQHVIFLQNGGLGLEQ